MGTDDEDKLVERDAVFDLAHAVLKYDEALRLRHPDAPSLQRHDEATEIQLYYAEMRERAAAILRKIARASVPRSAMLTNKRN